jgi:hypothetical protein
MTKLYEIADSLQHLQNIDTDDDEIDQESLTAALEDLQGEFNEKAIMIRNLAKNIKADIDGFDAEIKRMRSSMAALKNRHDWLKQYVNDQMKAAGIDKVKIPGRPGSVSRQIGREKIVITDESKIPSQFIKPVEPEYNKTLMMEAARESDFDGFEIGRSDPFVVFR